MKYILILLLLVTQMILAKNTESKAELIEVQKNYNLLQEKYNDLLQKINFVTVVCACDITDENGQVLDVAFSTGEGQDLKEAYKNAAKNCKTSTASHTKVHTCLNTKTGQLLKQ